MHSLTLPSSLSLPLVCFLYFPFYFLTVLAGETLRTGQSTWVRRSSLVDSRTAVTDVQFSPKHLGLQLVSVKNRVRYLLTTDLV